MPAYHIHITGMVQGVGFRPYVHKLAVQQQLNGRVHNGSDGVHIYCSGSQQQVTVVYETLLQQPPPLAIITGYQMEPYAGEIAPGFFIDMSTGSETVDMLITPDIALCDDCRRELNDPGNRRYRYPFTTCVNCGPRYSITTALPYDRRHTTMEQMPLCNSCQAEYNDVQDTRHHSQTNSCPDCRITMHLYDAYRKEIPANEQEQLQLVNQWLQQGKIIAVKNTGGYLLLCDATNAGTILLLRERKHRPAKPFALLYADLEMLGADVNLRGTEIHALKDKAAPIVLCRLKPHPENRIVVDQIAPGLQRVGAMLPSSPLLELISKVFGRPLIATSANLSGSPMIYDDAEALHWLPGIADHILTYDREIVAPQDDSVLQFSSRGQKIILRRSRGLAPNYYPLPFSDLPADTLAMGGELKSAFAVSHAGRLFISQFLGDQQSVESQESYERSLQHVSRLLNFTPKHIVADKHPRYQVSQRGRDMAAMDACSFTEVQHHEAHFAAVMAEHDLFAQKQPVLGITWDGTGYGNDGQVWGGEVFLYDQGEINRVVHLDYFPQLLADKMSHEPRLSALSILGRSAAAEHRLKHLFTEKEWVYYQQLLQQPARMQTSSMGRLIDAVACLLGLASKTSYEGEAAMKLEALAQSCTYHSYDYYSMPLTEGVWNWQQLIHELLEDWQHKEPNEMIAWKFFYSLAKAIAYLSSYYDIDKLAFSGGVFQNALLVDMIMDLLQHKRKLYFHKQVSPNDECISLGQLAWYAHFGDRPHTSMEAQKKRFENIIAPLMQVQ
ncbi:MAG: carbamoyltransferase HypF [Bacteroidota bacterium]|nr:carbamoyltransferase HypF [Bacteroidota bacterium]